MRLNCIHLRIFFFFVHLDSIMCLFSFEIDLVYILLECSIFLLFYYFENCIKFLYKNDHGITKLHGGYQDIFLTHYLVQLTVHFSYFMLFFSSIDPNLNIVAQKVFFFYMKRRLINRTTLYGSLL